jgi:hypothetical protein
MSFGAAASDGMPLAAAASAGPLAASSAWPHGNGGLGGGGRRRRGERVPAGARGGVGPHRRQLLRQHPARLPAALGPPALVPTPCFEHPCRSGSGSWGRRGAGGAGGGSRGGGSRARRGAGDATASPPLPPPGAARPRLRPSATSILGRTRPGALAARCCPCRMLLRLRHAPIRVWAVLHWQRVAGLQQSMRRAAAAKLHASHGVMRRRAPRARAVVEARRRVATCSCAGERRVLVLG